MTGRTVAVVHLGHTEGLGALRRVRSTREVFEAAGAEVVEVRLRAEHRARPADLLHADVPALARGEVVPETLAWSRTSLAAHLDAIDPVLVVCNTARAFHPGLARNRPVVLDLVDRLSVSYRDRARVPGTGARRLLFRALAPLAHRFERRPRPAGVTTVAAGWEDAAALGATWVPNTVRPGVLPARPATADVVFFGNLSYPPNVEAVEAISRFWPRLTARRPGTTLLLAGAHPAPRVLALARGHGWRVWAAFPDLAEMLAGARIAVAPLTHASGIQSKVLEAAAFGVPQVLSPAALAGLAPGFPAAVAADERAWVDELVSLLDDRARRVALGRAAREHVAETYAVERWSDWAAETLAASTR